MTHWIEATCEPSELILAWQPAALDAATRYRWAVGRLVAAGSDMELRYFEAGEEFQQFNGRKTFEELQKLGYIGYPAFSISKPFHSEGVKQALMRRLPPRSRSDFGAYAAQFRLRNADLLSDFALLARTEAKVPSDGFSIVDPLDAQAKHCDLLIEIAGYRHYKSATGALAVGDVVQVAAEPDNEYDPGAVAIFKDGAKIGYINRLQTTAFRSWLKHLSIHAVVERINGTDERPRVFLFVQVRLNDQNIAA